jgi:hypothetical protein
MDGEPYHPERSFTLLSVEFKKGRIRSHTPQNRSILRAGLRSRRGGRTLWLVWLAVSLLLPQASAHDFFTAFIQHRISVRVTPEHIDLTVDLTFFEAWSLRERRRMDANSDGRISHIELEDYLKRFAAEWERQVRLFAGGTEVPLTALYEPEADLLGSALVGPDHHQLRLFLFGTTPADLAAGLEFTVEDRLWPDARRLTILQLEADGGTLEPVRARPPEAQARGQLLKFRIVTPPHQRPLATGSAPHAPREQTR